MKWTFLLIYVLHFCVGMHAEPCMASLFAKRPAIAADDIDTHLSTEADEQDKDLKKLFVAHVAQHQRGSKRGNKLQSDSEQREEHADALQDQVHDAIERIKQRLGASPDDEQLVQHEQALRAIAIHYAYQVQQNDCARSRKQLLNTLHVAGFVKLLQDPHWQDIFDKTMQPACGDCSCVRTAFLHLFDEQEISASSIEQELTTEEPACAYLLKQLVDGERKSYSLSLEQMSELHRYMQPAKKDPDELLDAVGCRVQSIQQQYMNRPKKVDSERAKEFYNRAAMAEIDAEIQFNKVRHPSQEYLHLEQIYYVAVELYFMAHDFGHPSALDDAKKLLSGGFIPLVVSWKQKQKLPSPTSEYAEHWRQYNERERGDK